MCQCIGSWNHGVPAGILAWTSANERLYHAIPHMQCRVLCRHHCQPIHQRLRAALILITPWLDTPRRPWREPGAAKRAPPAAGGRRAHTRRQRRLRPHAPHMHPFAPRLQLACNPPATPRAPACRPAHGRRPCATRAWTPTCWPRRRELARKYKPYLELLRAPPPSVRVLRSRYEEMVAAFPRWLSALLAALEGGRVPPDRRAQKRTVIEQ